jgi:hypothetical protein
MLAKVDFPLPLGPMTAVNEPVGTSKLASRQISRPPRRTETSRNERAESAVLLWCGVEWAVTVTVTTVRLMTMIFKLVGIPVADDHSRNFAG